VMKKFCINGQLRHKLFLIIIYRFSLVKAAKNAQFPKGEQKPSRTCQSFRSLDSIYDCKLRVKKYVIQMRIVFSPQHLNWLPN
jgi:hypothetical protein